MNSVLIRRSSESWARSAFLKQGLRKELATAALVLAGSLLGSWGSAATSYRVQPGDNLSSIAGRAGVSVSALRAANPSLRNADQVRAGVTLMVPNRQLPGKTYRVRSGENLTVIAHRSGMTVGQLLRANPQLQGGRLLRAGAVLQIPGRTVAARIGNGQGGERPEVQASRPARGRGATVRPASIRVSVGPAASGWLWPVAGHAYISSGFGDRTLEGEHEMHYGVDIVAPEGTPVRAARAGRVLESRADFARGWGWTVVMEHEGGWITRYAHLSQNLVRAGEYVTRGQTVGRVGSTGRSTGAHLHFGTYLRWNPRDPLALY
ncbi:LysM peptidoglycan-binding domain-containing M23 family metallopeptidase [Deinococcus hopiensis]|uniref:Murein DD-endopeptidase MepM and murein hydrolase activator NlpD, contain LysM domain n=1 Tax=Deinococcus hopiensis KR-140 TaxID=695939 RepID=A0A1W1V8C2_9DEIO|nr:M23 family metallopeptidase [Deinococcus hopiensis]SMB89254.1 Murein DD-endopeptidase MepM and murein hydrolase activator NlpD, contain LysM domain [Deinococcus hopiensis KR-140]